MTRTVGRALVGLYPQAVRDRWGLDLVHEADRAGWRELPQLVVAIAGMWMHPAIWPAASFVERRRRVSAQTVLVVAVGWLTAHGVLELTGAVPRALAHSWLLTACDLATFTGLLLAVPVPRLRRPSIVRLAWRISRRLTVPAAAGVLIVYAANRGVAPEPAVRGIVVAGWWLTLMIAASQSVRTVADVDLSDVVMPGPRRLRLGLWCATIGLVGSGVDHPCAGVGGERRPRRGSSRRCRSPCSGGSGQRYGP